MRRTWAQASGLARSTSDRVAPATVVAGAAGIQAQDERAACLSLWARGRHLDASAIDRALVGDRSVVRTWAMRGTLHLVPAEDVRWLLALLGPVFVAGSQRRYRELGLDERAGAAGVAAIGEAVAAEGPLTRAALGERTGTSGQALAHLVRRAALEGVICCGPHGTYVALADWLHGPEHEDPTGQAALGELARRHLAAFGPARPEDLAAWSGLPLARARTAWRLVEAELKEVVAAGRPAWVLNWTFRPLRSGHAGRSKRTRRPSVRLLPAFDTYLLGHKSRELIVEDRFSRRVWPGGGWIHSTVVADGKVVATWKLNTVGDVDIEWFTNDVIPGVDAEAQRLHAFLATS